MIKKILIFIIFLSVKAFAGWTDPVVIDTYEHLAYPQIQARGDSIYVIYQNKFVRSLDGGQSWQDEFILPECEFIQDSDFRLRGDTLAVFYDTSQYFTNHPAFYFSTNFGETWEGPRYCGQYAAAYQFFSCNYQGDTVSVCSIENTFDDYFKVLMKNSYDFGMNWAEPESIWYYDHAGFPKLYYYYGKPYILSELDQGGILSSVKLLYDVDGELNWHEIDLFSGSGITFEHNMGASPNGQMAVVYEDGNSWVWLWSNVLFRASSDSGVTWGPIIDLSETRSNHDPRVDVSGDTAAVIWEGQLDTTSFDRQLFFRKSFDLGQNWEPFEILTAEDESEINPDITIADGKIHIVYVHTGHQICYRRWEPETAVEEIEKPENVSLSSVYPNPFNSSTTISYNLQSADFIKIDIFDIQGRCIDKPVRGFESAGYHQVVWEPGEISSGIYFIRLSTHDISKTEKIILLK